MIALLILAACGEEHEPVPIETPPRVEERPDEPERTVEAEPETPAGLRCLLEAYSGVLREGERGVELAGAPVVWDDAREKDLEARIADPDLEDVLFQRYPSGAPLGAVAEGFEPGRVRHYPLLEAAYGRDPEEVARNLVEVRWPFQSKRLEFQSRNGAATALEAVAERLASSRDSVRRCVAPSAGTFNTRVIRGTDQLSAHSYGIAIDVAISCGDYWQWARPFTGVWRNRLPEEIVAAFEAERFVWGGRWHRYDTMHFEYRPELFDCKTPRAP